MFNHDFKNRTKLLGSISCGNQPHDQFFNTKKLNYFRASENQARTDQNLLRTSAQNQFEPMLF